MTEVRWTYQDISAHFGFETKNGHGSARNFVARLRKRLAEQGDSLDEQGDLITGTKTFSAGQLLEYRRRMPRIREYAR
jgi:hypothetical protein